MKRKTPAALLAACSLVIGLGACGAGAAPGAPEASGTGGASTAASPSTAVSGLSIGEPAGAASATPGQPPPIGAQPVPNTPVEALPEHPDHAPIAEPSPQPGLEAQALSAEAPPAYTREWVVSPNGNDGGDGSAAQPLRTIAMAVSKAGPGEVIRVQAGTYAERIVLGDNVRPGTPEQKITLQGEGRPHIVPGGGGGALVQVRRPGWVIDGFDLDVQGQPIFGVTFEGDVKGSVLANSELHHGTGGGGVTTFNNATGPTVENNHIHDFVRTTGNQDSHGVVVQPTSHDVTVRNNDIHDNSGDSVQCLGPEGFSSLPPADGVLVENNHFFGNRENAVDIKTCHNVVVRNNRMHHFQPSATAKGDAVVVHYSAQNVLVEDNEIYDAAKGISVGGNHEGPVPQGVILRRNRVHDLTNAGGGEGTGIRLENSTGTVVLNNTITRAVAALIVGHGTGGPTANLQVENNIVDAPIAVDLGGQAPGLKMASNLYPAGAQFKQNGALVGLDVFKAATGDGTSTAADPGLTPPAFSPAPIAVDKGADVGLPFCGGAPDLGAVELGC